MVCRYSFDHGPMHFLQFSTEHDFSPGSEQFAWIVDDLKTVDRRRTPWLIAGFHRPFYTDSVYGNSDTGDVGFTADIQNALERLFFQFQVCPPRALLVNSYRTCVPTAWGHTQEGLGSPVWGDPLPTCNISNTYMRAVCLTHGTLAVSPTGMWCTTDGCH